MLLVMAAATSFNHSHIPDHWLIGMHEMIALMYAFTIRLALPPHLERGFQLAPPFMLPAIFQCFELLPLRSDVLSYNGTYEAITYGYRGGRRLFGSHSGSAS